jgi:hypothetical protein
MLLGSQPKANSTKGFGFLLLQYDKLTAYTNLKKRLFMQKQTKQLFIKLGLRTTIYMPVL